MNRKEKFKQANREANATWLALLIVIVFWCVAGFGLADVKVEFSRRPCGSGQAASAPGCLPSSFL